jgi:hypothetical protein
MLSVVHSGLGLNVLNQFLKMRFALLQSCLHSFDVCDLSLESLKEFIILARGEVLRQDAPDFL